LKLTSPAVYGASGSVKVPPETINGEQSQAKGKAKARYPHTPLGISQANGQAGKMKRAAYTPGGPEGS
jgi:hypothetical protein